MARLRPTLVSLLAAAALAACSDSPVAPELSPSEQAEQARKTKPPRGGTSTPDTTSSTPTSPTSPSGTTVTGCDGSAVTLTADEKTTFDLHQQTRAQYGLPLFCVHPRLVDAARAHSADMVAKNYFSHVSADGTNWDARIVSFGYTGATALSENIAWGSGPYGEPATVMNNWMNSSGHRATILNGGLREIGIGIASGYFQGYSGARVYTADFGTR